MGKKIKQHIFCIVFTRNSKPTPRKHYTKNIRFICQIALAMYAESSIERKNLRMKTIPHNLLIGTGDPVPLAFLQVITYGTHASERVICMPEPVSGKWYRMHEKQDTDIILAKKVLEWTAIEDKLVVYSYLHCLTIAQAETFTLLSKWSTAGFRYLTSVPPWWVKYELPELYAEALEAFFYAQGKTFRKW
jgi:hypothetical protein